jgi:hypothetical protein
MHSSSPSTPYIVERPKILPDRAKILASSGTRGREEEHL